MSWLDRFFKPKERPDVYFRYGYNLHQGVYLGDLPDGTSLVRLTRRSYPWRRGEVLNPSTNSIVKIEDLKKP